MIEDPKVTDFRTRISNLDNDQQHWLIDLLLQRAYEDLDEKSLSEIHETITEIIYPEIIGTLMKVKVLQKDKEL